MIIAWAAHARMQDVQPLQLLLLLPAAVMPAAVPRASPALAQHHGVALLDTEAWGDVGTDVPVPLLVPAAEAGGQVRQRTGLVAANRKNYAAPITC
jgi:hypothetical protein